MSEPVAEAALPPPPDLQLRGDPPRVMRLSRKTLSILGLLAGTAGLDTADLAGRQFSHPGTPARCGCGFAGLQDSTNYHWGGIAKAALLSTILGVGAQAGGSSDSDLVRAVRQGTSDTVSQTGQQIVRRQLNIQPTLTIRPGYPVRVIVTHDLVLAPPRVGEK